MKATYLFPSEPVGNLQPATFSDYSAKWRLEPTIPYPDPRQPLSPVYPPKECKESEMRYIVWTGDPPVQWALCTLNYDPNQAVRIVFGFQILESLTLR